jgi:hypothetical protein
MKKLLEHMKKWLADAKAGKEIPEADLTAALVLNAEDVKAYLETDEGKAIILPRIDQGVTKGIESFKKNNLEKLVEERFNAIHPPETPADKKMRTLEENLAKEKGERVRESLRNKLITEATKKNLPVDMIDLLVGADEETSLKNLGSYEQTFTKTLSAEVEKRFAQGGRKPEGANGGNPPKSFTREQMKDPAFVNANWADIEIAMANGTIK